MVWGKRDQCSLWGEEGLLALSPSSSADPKATHLAATTCCTGVYQCLVRHGGENGLEHNFLRSFFRNSFVEIKFTYYRSNHFKVDNSLFHEHQRVTQLSPLSNFRIFSSPPHPTSNSIVISNHSRFSSCPHSWPPVIYFIPL